MKILSITFSCLVFTSVYSFAQRPADKFERRVFYNENDSIKYALFIPEQVDSTSDLFPLIFTISGSLSIVQDDYMFGRMTETWAEDLAQQENPTFVFTAQIPNQSQDLAQYIDRYWAPTVSLILDSLIQEFPIDTTRLYITGASLGSMITWGFIYWSETERFAAAVPMSGGSPPIASDPVITDIPIWAFCGVSDVGTIDAMRIAISTIEGFGYLFERIYSTYGNIGFTIDEIASLDKRHIYTEFTDGAHDIWDETYDDPVLHYWLFSQRNKTSNPPPQFPEWKVYTKSNSGLPSNSINCISIDKSNTKWIGTSEGLVKITNNSWRTYDISNSDLPSNYINCMDIDQFGNKWIGTHEGLVKFDGITWEIYDTSNSEIPSNNIGKIAIDHDDNKWLGEVWTEDFKRLGLVKFDNATWTLYDTTNSGLPSNDVFCIEIDADNNKWIGTSIYAYGPGGGEGLAKFNDTSWTVFNKDNSGLPNNSIVDIEIDNSNSIWILNQAGLVKFDGILWTLYERLSDNCGDVFCLEIDKQNNKWLGLNGITNGYGTNGCGISIFDDIEWKKLRASESSLPSNMVTCISIDNFGNKWIGTRSQMDGEFLGGLAVYNEEGIVTSVFNDEISNKIVPSDYVLFQNYPNPFNPTTTIKYQIPEQAMPAGRQVRNDKFSVALGGVEESFVTLKVYDILGRDVATLVNQKQNPGNYEVNWNASNVPSGVYFYQLTAGASTGLSADKAGSATGFAATKKMILLR